MKVLIDNGHGENTPGKRSPDGRLREWAYTREIADMVIFGLRKKGVDAERIVKEDTDAPLSERCRRANDIYKETGKKAILVSTVRKPMPNQLYWQQNLAICRDTNCPAVLTENFFQDNKEDVEYLLSQEGKQTVTQIHIDGIVKYLSL